MFRKNKILFICCLVTISTWAQNSQTISTQGPILAEPCGTMPLLLHQKNNNTEVAKKLQTIEAHTQKVLQNQSNKKHRVKEIITIPVVFHVVYNNAAQNLNEERIRSQLEVLNEDFRMRHADVDQTLPIFKDRAADMEIEFCLAQQDPEGLPTTGIQYFSTQVDTFFFSAADPQFIKFNEMGGADAWPADQYLNIWIGNLENDLLGYAQFPGMEKSTDGIVLNYVHVGRIGTQSNITGRTATHEVGHWLNLRHIWGDGDCSADDDVEDTPLADGSNAGCPLSIDSCNDNEEPDMVQNYMDYTSDKCSTLFTKGQKERVRALFEPGGARENIINSLACTQPVLKNTDARLIELTNAKQNQNYCATNFTPTLQFRNFGNNTLTQLTIETSINEIIVDTFYWTGNVPTGRFAVTDLNNIELQNGTQTLKVQITQTNNQVDDHPEDNVVVLNIQALGRTVPFNEGFEQNSFPPIYTNIIDADGEGFELKKGVAYTGNQCMFINCFDYNVSGAIDEFILPIMDFSSTGNPMLTFYNAYARYDNEDSDTLEILISKDCGQNYTSVYKKQGPFIASVGYRQEYFEPTDQSQWRQRVVNLKDFEGEVEVFIKFRCINSHEQNLYIDDIVIFGDDMIPTTQYLVNNALIQLYPNPVYNKLNIQVETAEKYQLLLRSVDGQIVFIEDQPETKINIEHLIPGIYLAEIQTSKGRFSKKIIKL